MKKLKIGFKDRSAQKVDIEGVTFFLKPLAQEIMTGLALYSQGHRDVMMAGGEKKEFIKTHLTDWSDLYDEDDKEVKFTTALAVEYLTHDDYDDLFMMLYWKSIDLSNVDIEEKETAKKKVKK